VGVKRGGGGSNVNRGPRRDRSRPRGNEREIEEITWHDLQGNVSGKKGRQARATKKEGSD